MSQAGIAGKIVVTGRLKLLSPLLICSGMMEAGSSIDMQLLKDKSGVPFIPGTSLAGVLRSFAEEYAPDAYEGLFGSEKTAGKGTQQSAVCLRDVVLEQTEITVRDGVTIDPVTGTALQHHKFDFEAVERGAEGDFRMVITLRNVHFDDVHVLQPELQRLIDGLLQLLANGIQLGGRTAIGLGRAQVRDLVVDRYDFTSREDAAAWLAPDGPLPAASHYTVCAGGAEPRSEDFDVEATFALAGSLIVRDYFPADAELGADKKKIAAVSKKSGRDYLIPGSSLKGVMRHRAAYILQQLGRDSGLVEHMMGPEPKRDEEAEQKKRKSRLSVDEVYIRPEAVVAAEQSRNRIDRFTGGTIDTVLFTTKPLWSKGDESVVSIHFAIRRAQEHEAGLGLCLLKDLWLGRLTVGGEKSIGRGVLRGLKARIKYQGETYEWEAGKEAAEETVMMLDSFVKALAGWNGMEDEK